MHHTTQNNSTDIKIKLFLYTNQFDHSRGKTFHLFVFGYRESCIHSSLTIVIHHPPQDGEEKGGQGQDGVDLKCKHAYVSTYSWFNTGSTSIRYYTRILFHFIFWSAYFKNDYLCWDWKYMFVKVWTDKRGLNLQFTASNCFRFYLLHQIASQFNVERINNTGNLTWFLAYWVIFVSNSSIFSLLQCFDNLYSWIKCLTLTWIFLLILDTINSKLSIGSISQEMLSTPIKQNKIWCLNHLKRCIIHVHNTCVYANR